MSAAESATNDQQVLLTLGRVEGKVDLLIANQNATTQRLVDLEDRVDHVAEAKASCDSVDALAGNVKKLEKHRNFIYAGLVTAIGAVAWLLERVWPDQLLKMN